MPHKHHPDSLVVRRAQPKDFVHIIGGFLIVLTLVMGTVSFMKHDMQDIRGLASFVPTGISTFLVLVLRIIVDGDVATTMCFLLLVSGFACLIIGLYQKDEIAKNAWIGGSSALIGLGAGVPFGDFLRKEEAKRGSRTS
jgi:hypothetical protein